MTANGEKLSWDRLIICSGFNYTLPEVPGNDLEGLTYVKNIRRGMELNETLNDVKKAVVLEATPLGVEMLAALCQRGIETHLVDPGAWLLSQVADPDIAEPVQESLEGLGCILHFGVGLQGFVGSERQAARGGHQRRARSRPTSASWPPTRSPRRRWRAPSGSSSAPPAASSVDERMRTSMDGVYAAGDCVEVPQGVTGVAVQGLTGAHAMQQGRVAGANAGGGARIYNPVYVPGAWSGGRCRSAARASASTWPPRWESRTSCAQANGISRARYYPGVQQVQVKLLAEPGTGRLHRRPAGGWRGHQGAGRLPGVRAQEGLDARGHRLDGERLLAAHRRPLRADVRGRPERAGPAVSTFARHARVHQRVLRPRQGVLLRRRRTARGAPGAARLARAPPGETALADALSKVGTPGPRIGDKPSRARRSPG